MAAIKKLQGKVAVITGGTTGIGLATAKVFVSEGAYVFITGRRQKELDEAVKAIGSNVTGVQGDIAKLADLDRLYEAVAAKGRIDIVFANAGVAEFTRPGLDRRSRSLVSMSVMIAMRQPHEFAIHMGAGLNNGLTLKEIEEVLIQALPYVGYPAIATALAAAAEVIKERGLDGSENYAGHRGLL